MSEGNCLNENVWCMFGGHVLGVDFSRGMSGVGVQSLCRIRSISLYM